MDGNKNKKLIIPIWVKNIYSQNKEKTLEQFNRIIRRITHPDRNNDPNIRERLEEWNQLLAVLKQDPNNLSLLDKKTYLEKPVYCQVCNLETNYEKDLICFLCKTMVHKKCKQHTYYIDLRCECCQKDPNQWFKTIWRYQPSQLFPRINKIEVVELQQSEEYYLCRLCHQFIRDEEIDDHIKVHQDESNEYLLEHYLMLPSSEQEKFSESDQNQFKQQQGDQIQVQDQQQQAQIQVQDQQQNRYDCVILQEVSSGSKNDMSIEDKHNNNNQNLEKQYSQQKNNPQQNKGNEENIYYIEEEKKYDYSNNNIPQLQNENIQQNKGTKFQQIQIFFQEYNDVSLDNEIKFIQTQPKFNTSIESQQQNNQSVIQNQQNQNQKIQSVPIDRKQQQNNLQIGKAQSNIEPLSQHF